MLTAAFQDSDYSILNSFPSIKDRNSTGRRSSSSDELMLEHCTSVTLTLRGVWILLYPCLLMSHGTYPFYKTSYLYHFCNIFFRFGLQDELICT